MPDENREIFIQIKVSEEQVKEKLEADRKALALLRKENAGLKAELKAGIITDAEYAKSKESIKKHLAATTAEIKKGEDTLKEYAKTQKSAEESLRNVRESAKLLLTDLAKLNAAERQHITSTKAVSDQIAQLSAQFRVENAAIIAEVSSLDKLDDAIAEVRTTYESLSKAQRENKDVGGKLLALEGDLIRQQDKADRIRENGRKTLKEYVGQIDILGFNIGQTVESFKSGSQAASLFAKGIGSGRGSLLALAAVPIIAILSGLYIILTKSQKGMDFLAKATSGVSSILSALSSKVIAVGEAFVGAFDNPKKALADLGNFVETNLINRFKAFGVILDAIRSGDLTKITDGFVQLTTGVEGAATGLKKVYDWGVAITELGIQIKEEEIKLNTERARSEKYIERQKQISEDATKSTKTRAAAARAAFAESQKIENAEEALQKKRVQLSIAEAKADHNTREARLKVSEEQGKLDEIGKNRIGERTELQNQLNTIVAEGAAKALENAKKVAAEEVAIAEEALVQAKKNGEDSVEIEAEILKRTITLIKAKADAEKVAVEAGRGAAAQRKLIQANADAEILEATKQTALKIAEIAYNAKVNQIETDLALTMRGSKQELDLAIKTIEANRNKQQEAARASIADKDKLAEEEALIVNTAARKISDAREAFEKDQVNKSADLANQRLQVQLDLGNQSLDNERDVAAKRIDLEEKNQIDLLEVEKKYGQISEEEYLTRLNTVQAKAIAARKDANKQILEADLNNEKAINDAKLILLRDGSKAQLEVILDNLKKEHKQKVAAAKEDKKALEEADLTFKNKSLKANKDYQKKLSEQIIDVANQAISTLGTIVDAQVAAQTAALDQQQQAVLSSAALTAEGRAKIEADGAKKRAEIERSANSQKKKVATAQNFINGALAITKAFAELGPLGGAIATAFIAAQTIASQVIIDNQKFAVGGVYRSDNKGSYITGPGSGTSDSINARISNGESIINAKSTAKHYPLLSAINSDQGFGRSFPGIRPNFGRTFDVSHAVPKFQYGGVNAGFDTDAIARAVVASMQGVNLSVAVTDIRRVDKNMKYVEAGADHSFGKKA